MENTLGDIKNLDIVELENLVRKYPWFAAARQELMAQLLVRGKEHFEVLLKKCSAFVVDRSRLYLLALEPQVEDESPVIDFDEMNREFNEITRGLGVAVAENEHPADEKSQNSPKYIVLGGDYFTKEDFADLEPVNSFKIGKLGDVEVEAECDVRSDSVENQMIGELGEDDGLDDFYTETLARIYAEQGYYEEAIKVYAKLILLYPEKSAYFATLVNDVKSKNN